MPALGDVMRLLDSGDRAEARRLLDARPEFVSMALLRGPAGATPVEVFLDGIGHQLYVGDTVLHVAAAAHDADVVAELVGRGAAVDAVNRRGAQPLHYAVDGSPGAARFDPDAQRQTVVRLVELGADLEARDRSGTTPLLRAVRNRCADAVDALLAAGADPMAVNAKGTSAHRLVEVSSGRSGSGSAAAKDAQVRIVELLDQARRVPRQTPRP